jgi:hypothetical protein
MDEYIVVNAQIDAVCLRYGLSPEELRNDGSSGLRRSHAGTRGRLEDRTHCEFIINMYGHCHSPASQILSISSYHHQ